MSAYESFRKWWIYGGNECEPEGLEGNQLSQHKNCMERAFTVGFERGKEAAMKKQPTGGNENE